MLDQILIVVGIIGLILFSIGAVYLNIEKQRRVNNEKRI